MGVLPSCLQPSIGWLASTGTVDRDGANIVRPAPLPEIEETIQAIRRTLSWGSMHLWADRCSRMEDWWRASASDANVETLLGSAALSSAASSIRRQRARDEKARRVWELAQAKLALVSDPNSWSCPRSHSLKLRSAPTPVMFPGFSSEETITEKALGMEGDRSTMKRLNKTLFPWY